MKTIRGLLLFCAMGLALVQSAQAQFETETNNGTISITGYIGSGGNVVIPATTNGLPVTSIGSNAFAGSYITTVTFGSNITTIGNGAFESCYFLTSVTIPDNITSIGAFAFYSYFDIQGENEPSITDITIGNGVTNIGQAAFSYCLNLSAITVSPQNSGFSSTNGVLFSKDKKTLVAYPCALANTQGSYCIPAGVTTIGPSAFEGCLSLTNVSIPDSVTSVGDYAFYNFWDSGDRDEGLSSLTIPDSVTNIGSYAFACCSLHGLTLGNSVISIGDWAFAYCYNITNVNIPNSVTSIGAYAFYNFTLDTGGRIGASGNLQSVTIGDNVTNIGDFAFAECADLVGVTFQGNAPTVDSTAFYDDPVSISTLPGTTGWSASGLSTVPWNPKIQTTGPNFGVNGGRFGFDVTGTDNFTFVVQACTNLNNPVWSALGTNTLNGGTFYFEDPFWTNCANRFYRLIPP